MKKYEILEIKIAYELVHEKKNKIICEFAHAL